jgi:bifunctional DNase/RNase
MPDSADLPSPDPVEMIEARLDSISVTNVGFIVFLKGDDDGRVLPIFIGANEAQSIALALGDEPAPRPMTHDLLKTMLESLDAAVTKVEITHLREGTFYGRVHMIRGGIEETEFDARPSDAIALALRFEAPIFMARKVFDEAAVSVVSKGADVPTEASEASGAAGTEAEPSEETGTQESAVHPSPSPAEKLRAELDDAVSGERYEEAARLRDALKRLMSGN